MILLSPDNYSVAEGLLSIVEINSFFALSVIKHHVKGKIFVDNVTEPNCFYVLHPSGMSLLFGKVSNAFLTSSLKRYLLGKTSLRKSDESLQVFPANLEKRIDAVLGNELCEIETVKNQDYSAYSVVKYKRINFSFNLEKFEAVLGNLEIEASIFKKIDKTLYKGFTGVVVPNGFWDSADDFQSSGTGFALIYNDQPAAVAFSSFQHHGILELGVETKAEFRNRGLATIVCAKLILHCLQEGYEPVWSCRLGNNGSYNLALKLGFEVVASLPYYELLMDS